jgi:hypothetical protein
VLEELELLTILLGQMVPILYLETSFLLVVEVAMEVMVVLVEVKAD